MRISDWSSDVCSSYLRATIMKRGHRTGKPKGGYPRFWGRHAVTAALANPNRTVRKIWGTLYALGELDLAPGLPLVYSYVAYLGRMVPHDAPHQGLVVEVEPLEDIWLGDMLEEGRDDKRPILVLDQVTDPHNVGAILRSAAAFDALGIVTQDRHAPPESGVIAKAACGALEIVPWRSEEHTSELKSLMRISYAVLCFKKKKVNTPYSQKANKHRNNTSIKKTPKTYPIDNTETNTTLHKTH